MLSASFVDIYSSYWKSLTGCLGGARDWDVFLDETLVLLEEAFRVMPIWRSCARAARPAKPWHRRRQKSALSGRDLRLAVASFSAALFRLESSTIAAHNKSAALSLNALPRSTCAGIP